jgi:hypothetical protein
MEHDLTKVVAKRFKLGDKFPALTEAYQTIPDKSVCRYFWSKVLGVCVDPEHKGR